MVFIGFGFLMVFIKTYSWSSVGFTYICSAFAIECFILFKALEENIFKKLQTNLIVVKIKIKMS